MCFYFYPLRAVCTVIALSWSDADTINQQGGVKTILVQFGDLPRELELTRYLIP